MTLLDGSEKSLRVSFTTFSLFENCSGLRVNIDKTLVAKLGTKVREKKDLCPDLGLKVVTEFTLLGISFSTVKKSSFEMNVKSKMEQIE